MMDLFKQSLGEIVLRSRRCRTELEQQKFMIDMDELKVHVFTFLNQSRERGEASEYLKEIEALESLIEISKQNLATRFGFAL